MLTLDAVELMFHYYDGCRGHRYVCLKEFLDFFRHMNCNYANNPVLCEQILYKLSDVKKYLEEEG